MYCKSLILKATIVLLLSILMSTIIYCQVKNPQDCQCYNFRNTGTFSMASGVEFRIDAPNYEAGRFFIDNDGNVGIGVLNKNPLAKLHVNGHSFLNGNVGIGTSAPQAALEVNGKSIFDGDVTFKKNVFFSGNFPIPDTLNIPKSGYIQLGSDVRNRGYASGQIAYQKYTSG